MFLKFCDIFEMTLDENFHAFLLPIKNILWVKFWKFFVNNFFPMLFIGFFDNFLCPSDRVFTEPVFGFKVTNPSVSRVQNRTAPQNLENKKRTASIFVIFEKRCYFEPCLWLNFLFWIFGSNLYLSALIN